jgi:hypothetical protein
MIVGRQNSIEQGGSADVFVEGLLKPSDGETEKLVIIP